MAVADDWQWPLEKTKGKGKKEKKINKFKKLLKNY